MARSLENLNARRSFQKSQAFVICRPSIVQRANYTDISSCLILHLNQNQYSCHATDVRPRLRTRRNLRRQICMRPRGTKGHALSAARLLVEDRRLRYTAANYITARSPSGQAPRLALKYGLRDRTYTVAHELSPILLPTRGHQHRDLSTLMTSSSLSLCTAKPSAALLELPEMTPSARQDCVHARR